jgi:hypothetical protein
LQRPERRLAEFKPKVMPLIEERVKNLPSGYLMNYIRRVININDTVPGIDNLNASQSRNILEFIAGQESIKDITPPILYTLVQTILNDAKISSRTNTDVSFSKLIEKHRLEGGINQLLSKIPKEEGQVTENFIEALIYQNANLTEVPNYFVKTLKTVIANGHPTPLK